MILEGYGLTETSAGVVRQPPRPATSIGTVGPVVPRQRGQDRRRRRGHDQGPRRHGRLPQPARGDGEDADLRRLAAHRRQGRRSTPTATWPSPAASRSSSRPPAASTSPRRRSSRSSRRSAPTPASSWSSATSATTASRSSPSTPTRWRAGPPRTAWAASPTPRSSQSDAVQAMVGGYVDELNSQAQPVGDHQEVEAPRPRPDDRVGRADPVDEGQAQRRRGEQQGADRRRCTPDGPTHDGDGCRWETTGTRSRVRRRGWMTGVPPAQPDGDVAPRGRSAPRRGAGRSSAASRSVSTSTCRSARCAAATATSTPTPPRSSATRSAPAGRRTPRRRSARSASRARCSATATSRSTRSSSAAARRRCSRPADLGADRGQRRRGVRPRRRRRDHHRGQPRQRRRLGPRGAAHRRLQPDQLRHAVRRRPRAAHARPHPRPDARAGRRRLGPAGRLRRRQPRPDLRHAGGVARRLGDLGRRGAGAASPTTSRRTR